MQEDPMPASVEDFAILEQPYLLVTFIPYYQDERNDLWLERSWHHDLIAHWTYLKNFTVCAPCLRKGQEPNLVRVEPPPGARFIALPPQTSKLRALLASPRTGLTLWHAIREAHIIHSSVIGWPYPLGWIANPLAVFQRKRLLVVVESSWRRTVPGTSTWSYRLFDAISDQMARWSCSHADLALFTQPEYRAALHTRGRGVAYVTPAVWINEGDILDVGAATDSWARKVVEPVRFLFAGRLVSGKGVDVLLSALRILDSRGSRSQVDIIGHGDRRAACAETAASLVGVRLNLLEPVPYGKAFFELVQSYHVLLLPSLTDEQPRVVFDANARAVPVIASSTDGLRPHVEPGKTGWLVPPGDPEALATSMSEAALGAAMLRDWGMAALNATRGRTHRAMHQQRSRLIEKHLMHRHSRADPSRS